MKNIFSPKLYVQGLRKVRNVGIAMAVIIVVLNAMIPMTCIIEDMMSFPTSGGYDVPTISDVGIALFAPVSLCVLLFAPLLVWSMFSYLNERKASDFYHAIPQKRVCVYFSFIAAVLTWLISVLLTSALVNAVLWGIAEEYTVTVEAVCLSTIAYIILAIVMVGFMALAMTLTGTTISNCLVFALVFLFVRAMGAFFLYMLEEVAPLFNLTNSWLQIFNLDFFLPWRLFYEVVGSFNDEVFYEAGMYIYWFIVGLLLIGVSAATYHFRKSESATKSAPSRLMQHIYRIAVTFPFVLLIPVFIIIDNSIESYNLILVVIALLVWILYELLTTKKIKNIVRSLPFLLVPVAMSAIFVGGVYTTKAIIYSTTPDREDMESVSLIRRNHSSSYEILSMYGIEIDDPNILDMVYKAIEETKNSVIYSETNNVVIESGEELKYYTSSEANLIYSTSISVKLKSGRSVSYNIRSSYDVFNAIKYSDECRKAQLSLPPRDLIDQIGVSHNTMTGGTNNLYFLPLEKLLDSFYEEYESLSDQQKYMYKNYDLTSSSYKKFVIFYLSGEINGTYFYGEYPLSREYMPKTTALFLKLYNNQNNALEVLSATKKLIDTVEESESNDYYYYTLNIIDSEGTLFTNANNDVMKDFLNALSMDLHLIDYENAEKIYHVQITIEPKITNLYYDGESLYYESEYFYLTLTDDELNLLNELNERSYIEE